MIYCYIYEGMADFEITLLMHRLRNSGGKTLCFISETTESIQAQSGMNYLPDAEISSIQDLSEAEALIIPGGPINNEQNAILPLAKKMDEAGKLIGAICFAPQFLARAGILDTHVFTTSCSPEKIRKTGDSDPFPWKNYKPQRVIRDGNIITAQGYAFADFALEVCEALHLEEAVKHLKMVKSEDFFE